MRIDPQEVKKAYEETGLTPKRGQWLNKRVNCACGLGVLAAKASQDKNVWTPRDWAEMEFGEAFTMGFADGFDGLTPNRKFPDYLEGYNNGKAVWEAVKPKEAVKP